MNKLLCIAAIITSILIFCCAFSRSQATCYNELLYWKETDAGTHVRIATIDSHDYIILSGHYTCSIIHAASCKCQKDLHN